MAHIRGKRSLIIGVLGKDLQFKYKTWTYEIKTIYKHIFLIEN